MKRFALLTLALLAVAPSARAGSVLPAVDEARASNGVITKHYVEVEPGVLIAVKGSRERRQVRFARLVEGWSEDKQAAAREFGFPTARWRDLTAGVLTEIWTYPGRNVQIVFDADGHRIDTRLF